MQKTTLAPNIFFYKLTVSLRQQPFRPETFLHRKSSTTGTFFSHTIYTFCTFLLQIPFTPNRFLLPKPWQHEKRFTPKPLTPCFTKILLLYTITFTYHIVRQKSVHRPSHTPNSHTASYRLIHTRIRSPNRNHFNATRKLLHQKPLQQNVSFTKNLYIFGFPHLSKLLRRKHFTQRTLYTRKLCTTETVHANKHLFHQQTPVTGTPKQLLHQKPYTKQLPPETLSTKNLFTRTTFCTWHLLHQKPCHNRNLLDIFGPNYLLALKRCYSSHFCLPRQLAVIFLGVQKWIGWRDRLCKMVVIR